MDLMNSSSHNPQQSVEGRPAIQRQSSTSSSGSGESSHTRPRKAIRSSRQRTSGSGAQGPEDEQSGSRRGSTSSMRTSSAPLEGPITYTPTTHRISKAKKGKRVHACEFPGCNKIFTRAEHRRRHELNHSPEASYPCDRAGCRKAFHRPDLLQRHQERHELEAQTEGGVIGHRRLPSDQSSASVGHSLISSTSMTSPMVSVQASSNGLSIPSLLHPQSSEGYSHGQHNSTFDFPRATFPMYTSSISATDDFIYSSPESSQSPLSDHYGFPHRNSMSSSSSVVDFVPPNCASPLVNTTTSGWAPVLPPSALPSNCSPLEDDIGGFSSSSAGAPIPIPISQLDRHEWLVLQRELASASGAVQVDHGGLEIFDVVKWQDDSLDCYWRHFHPFFPIVHQPTFSSTSSDLMTAIMVAISFQYDTQTNAKDYSLALLEACTKSLAKRDNIHSQSRLSDLQTVFLLEVLMKFRSRKAETGLSPRFRALFASLNHTSSRYWISNNPITVLKGLSKSPSAAELQQAHSFWLNRETRRRLLLCSFILDTQLAALFEQKSVLFPRWPGETISAHVSNLPYPCDNELWECATVEEWAGLATSFQQMTLSDAADPTIYDNSSTLDSFRARLIFTHLITCPPHGNTDSGTELGKFCETLARYDLSGRHGPAEFDIHAHSTAQHTPIRSLLIVSGESWLFGRKLEHEETFVAAKSHLREWVDSNQSQTALWHATALLRIVFDVRPNSPLQPVNGTSNQGREMGMLHEQWCIYIAALVCWACTFDASASSAPLSGLLISSTPPAISGATSPYIATSTPTGYPALMDPVEAGAEMCTFLQATNVDDLNRLPAVVDKVRGQAKGLLEVVRTGKLNGSLGGLINEARGVLYRLVEGRSQLFHF